MTARKRATAIASLILAGLLLTGCVYLRLLQLKWQLASFDEYVEVEHKDGLAFVFKKPLLLTDDMRWLGFFPSETEKDGEFDHWNMIFDKQYKEPSDEPDIYDMSVQLTFEEERLKSLRLSEAYLAIIPADLLVTMARSLGGAEIDRKNRTASVSIEDDEDGTTYEFTVPTIEDTITLLGKPYRESKEEMSVINRYHYHLKRPKDKEKADAKKPVYWIEMTFDSETGKLRRTLGDFYGGTLDIRFPPPDSSEKESE